LALPPHVPAVPARLAVFVSGTGRSLANLIDRAPDLPASIELVVASKACKAELIARDSGIATTIIARELTETELLALVEAHDIDLVVLAGYLRRVPVPESLAGKIVNIHPALLPGFGGKGMHGQRVHEAVLQAAKNQGLTVSGCTVHLCDSHYDTGRVLLQRTCLIQADDTPETLAARVFEQELIAYPIALASLIAMLS